MKQVFYNIYPPKELLALPDTLPHPLYISEYDGSNGLFHMMHQHSSIFEILIVLNGQSMYTLGHRRFFVQAGDVIVCNSEVIHDELIQQTPYKTLCLGGTNLKLPGLPENHLLPDSLNAVFHAPEQFHDLRMLMERMHFYVCSSKPFYKELCQSLMQACITLILQMVEERRSIVSTQEASITARIEDYISSHYSQELSLASIGKQFYINPYHLAHIFKAQTGHSVKQYILRRRIGEAQTMLHSTRHTIQHIAETIGFSDAAHFSKIFTKHVGISPMKYRILRAADNSQENT